MDTRRVTIISAIVLPKKAILTLKACIYQAYLLSAYKIKIRFGRLLLIEQGPLGYFILLL
jgi:hypothetical protein